MTAIVKSVSTSIFNFACKRSFLSDANRLLQKAQQVFSYRIPKLKIDCPLRERLISDILHEFLNIIKETLIRLDYDQLNKLSAPEFTEFWKLTFDMFFQELRIRMFLRGMPLSAMEILKERYSYLSEEMKEDLLQICNSDTMYKTNSQKVDAIFRSLCAFVDKIAYVAKETILELNGELTDIMLKSSSQYKCSRCNEGECLFTPKHQ